MKLITYKESKEDLLWQVGMVLNDRVIGLERAAALYGYNFSCKSMVDFLQMGQKGLELGMKLQNKLSESNNLESMPLINNVILAPPVMKPEKIICIGLNYVDHALEGGNPIPDEPVLFGKYSNAIIGPGEPIYIPPESSKIDYEAELAVVIGKKAFRVSPQEAIDYVAGYMNFNDVSARDLQKKDGQWMKGKFLNTFAPVGPWLVTTEEITAPNNLNIELKLNGNVMQSSNTNKMIFPIPEAVSYISKFATLEPGDIIATGTPPGVGYARKPPVYMKEGDEVEVAVEGLGVLKNPVKNR